MGAFTVAIGIFDGLHIGHRRLLEAGKKFAQKLQTSFQVLSFIYPFEYYLDREGFPGLLYPPTYRSAQLYNLGVDGVFFLDLMELKDLSPRDFVSLLKESRVEGIVVGSDFKFGKKAIGNVALLKDLASSHDIEVRIIPQVEDRGGKVSSSRIRSLIMEGKVKEAAILLGNPYKIIGEVVRGRYLGTRLNFPTANIERGHEKLVIPRFGVYLVKVRVRDQGYFGVMNIGVRPTVEGMGSVKYEVHIIGYAGGDLYEENIEVELIEYMRPELKFNSLGELQQAMEGDLKRAKEKIQAMSNLGRNE